MSTTEAALRLLARARSPEDVQAALTAAPVDDPRVRAGLLERYNHLDSNGPRLDPTTTVRSEILIALRGQLLATDLPLLEKAATTYERGYSGEIAGPLRAAGIVAIAIIDPARAKVHAVRLLADAEFTHPMSGEPALSAVRVLAAHGEPLVLYTHALGGATGEVLGECLRSLTELPTQLALLLAEQLRETRDEAALLGLVDLVLGHSDPGVAAGFLPGWLAADAPEDLYRYVATAAVASRREGLRAIIVELARVEVRRERRAILDEALTL
jgi:hypothetical protein